MSMRSAHPGAFNFLLLGLFLGLPGISLADDKLPPVSERARRVHEAGMLFDGHNDLPWRFRTDGDFTFTTLDIPVPPLDRANRHPSDARGWFEGAVLVGLHSQRASQPRQDCHRAD